MNARLVTPFRAAVLALGCLALAGCEYVYNVVVPAFDSNPPVAIPTIYLNGDYIPCENKTFTTNNENAGWYALAAGFDAGGTKKLVMHREAFATYSLGGGIGQSVSALLAPRVLTQGGSVGSTVKNGLWTVEWVRPSDYDNLGSSGTLLSCGFTYWVEAEDYHGNKSIRDGGTFVYDP